MAFKYVPDYWAFRAVAEADLFKWRADLELRLVVSQQKKWLELEPKNLPRVPAQAAWSCQDRKSWLELEPTNLHARRLRPRGGVAAIKIGLSSSRKICYACRLRPRGRVAAAKTRSRENKEEESIYRPRAGPGREAIVHEGHRRAEKTS